MHSHLVAKKRLVKHNNLLQIPLQQSDRFPKSCSPFLAPSEDVFIRVTCLKTIPQRASKHQETLNKLLDLLIREESILRVDVQFEASLTVAADERTGQQSHAGDGQQLDQTIAREQVIERRHFGEHGACLDTDEVVGKEACKQRQQTVSTLQKKTLNSRHFCFQGSQLSWCVSGIL